MNGVFDLDKVFRREQWDGGKLVADPTLRSIDREIAVPRHELTLSLRRAARNAKDPFDLLRGGDLVLAMVEDNEPRRRNQVKRLPDRNLALAPGIAEART